jgi:uncharacterized protein (DUF488 family)
MDEGTSMTTLFTIGFTQKTAEQFFTLLKKAGVKRILDIRLNNVSQLAGFAKRDDLRFFLREICHADYRHLPECAPTAQILNAFKKQKGDWRSYVEHFLALIHTRRIENVLTLALLDHGCLLCSEATPERCHRRLVAEYMRGKMPDLRIVHL